MVESPVYIRWFSEIGLSDVAEVGGKNASLGEMYRNMSELDIRVPNGFAVTAAAYRGLLEHGNAWPKLHKALDGLNPDDMEDLQQRGRRAREIVLGCELPKGLEQELLAAYASLREEYGEELSLAVRSSATAEDSPDASFAGQNESYLHIRGANALIDAYKHCLASNFTDRSIHYKYDNHFDWSRVDLSVVVMKMVRSDIGASGVMFSLDTETGFRDVAFINAAWGLGENVVQGTIDPDSFYVHKPTFNQGYHAVLKRRLGSKEQKMIFTDGPLPLAETVTVGATANIDTTVQERCSYSITDADVMTLAEYAIKVENHYSLQAGEARPMDMEWARDGLDGLIYMVQARPETVASHLRAQSLEIYHIREHSALLVQGQAVGGRIGSGKARVIGNAAQLSLFQAGEVLVADTTSPDWEPVMKMASAIVTNQGGRTCHAAIVARELGVPAIVGAAGASKLIHNGQEITVCCAEGEIGNVYAGLLPFDVERVDLGEIQTPVTQIMMNLGNPDKAFSYASLPVAGVGLARLEFIINEYIGIHPMAIRHPEKLDHAARQQIAMRCATADSPSEFFIRTLAEGVATIAASVYPRPCIVRMSDFKSNEYATLIGGTCFEPQEENPMIGFRGASRYAHPAYAEGFALECAAMKRVRDQMGMTNVRLMIPFCRTVAEGQKVLAALAVNGLERGINGLEIYVMCEVPNNVIQIDAFAALFDGFSIGSNDLTQLTLGVDRDSQIVSFDFDERDPGVLIMIKMAVEGARRNSRHSGICGQAPSDYPEMTEQLIRFGIESISLNPDAVLKTIRHVLQLEQALATETAVRERKA